ncbi:MAG TPA: class I SAM-dependent methyltransferase [Pirellulales bacterium]|nr:class I SAM-dependent methyltransferase [Pirellulales bacterium]
MNRLLRLLRPFRDLTRYRIPAHLEGRFRVIDGEAQAKLKAHLHEFRQAATGAASAEDDDLMNHLYRRLDEDRRSVIPWLDAARPLAGASVLEIGCGTGSSTVALAEQGARVTGIDIDPGGIAVAEERCRLYGVEAQFRCANASELEPSAGERFDFILFFASLEHMTHPERLEAMARTWKLLPSGGLWGVVETPNRLWYFDHHTAHLNFFMWLSDELAADYVQFSPRDDVRRLVMPAPDRRLALARAGRGVSFHEFDLTLGDSRSLDVVSSMPLFFRQRDLALRLQWRLTREHRFERFLADLCPGLHHGFLQPTLYLLIRKP